MKLALFIGLLAFANTCHETDEEPEIVICLFPCIDARIVQFKTEPVTSPRASITMIHAKSGIYYLISAYNETPSVILNYHCEVVCYPNEDATARTTASCPEFADEIERQVIWKDER